MQDDVRRRGGGMGLWLGMFTWTFISSLAIGFLIGACVIAELSPAWGFYIVTILLGAALILNVITPETREHRHRKTVAEVSDRAGGLIRRSARGEICLHVYEDDPQWWVQEVTAGVALNFKMLRQSAFAVLAIYLGWIYAQVVLIIVVRFLISHNDVASSENFQLLGALLSRQYRYSPISVGLGVVMLAVGALLAVPLSSASLFSRSRRRGPRTDSLTFQPQVTWTSHLVRRVLFTLALPFAALAYTMVSTGPTKIAAAAPIVFATLIGFFSNLAIAEIHGIIMETYDFADLQPGVNSRHRLQSLAPETRKRRTNYSCFPRVSSAIFVSQSLGFLFAAGATGIGGSMTRNLGAYLSTGIGAAVLLGLTVAFTIVLWRWKEVQVIPSEAFGARAANKGSDDRWLDIKKREESYASVEEWRPVVIGNPSGRMRRMNLLELGEMSRWTEIRRLNRLIRD